MCPDTKEKIKVIRNWSHGFDLFPYVDGYLGITWLTKKEMHQAHAPTKKACVSASYNALSNFVWARTR